MNWDSWSTFFDMGGAAFFVWGSYGLTALLIVAEIYLLRVRRINSTRRLLRLQRASASRKFSEVHS